MKIKFGFTIDKSGEYLVDYNPEKETLGELLLKERELLKDLYPDFDVELFYKTIESKFK